jgi:uracil phosphoribosyltransferase
MMYQKAKLFKDDEIANLMAYEITKDVPTKSIQIETPVGTCQAAELAKEIVLIPILRAALGMVDGISNLIPTAKVGHIGLYRDHDTLEPKDYYSKLPPNTTDAVVLVLDPMLATGKSVLESIDMICRNGIPKHLHIATIFAAPEGIKFLEAEIKIPFTLWIGNVDQKLNDKFYIIPGLGDAGDLAFGPKI